MCEGAKNAAQPQEPTKEITVHTSSLFDSKAKCFVSNITLVIDSKSGLITKVYKREGEGIHNEKMALLSSYTPPRGFLDHDDDDDVGNDEKARDGSAAEISREVLDLRDMTVLPGLVDAHTHVFLHEDAPSVHQMRDESTVERVVRATQHARAALDAGFTTYRDLGTEGLGDADARFRDTINRGLTPGPRMFVATECIASSAGYETRRENGDSPGTGLRVPRISDPADGVDGVRAAVRRRCKLERPPFLHFLGQTWHRVTSLRKGGKNKYVALLQDLPFPTLCPNYL